MSSLNRLTAYEPQTSRLPKEASPKASKTSRKAPKVTRLSAAHQADPIKVMIGQMNRLPVLGFFESLMNAKHLKKM